MYIKRSPLPKEILDSAILILAAGPTIGITEVQRQEALLETGALQDAILNSANFSSIATDEKGVMDALDAALEFAGTIKDK
jgi:hypothetical protein